MLRRALSDPAVGLLGILPKLTVGIEHRIAADVADYESVVDVLRGELHPSV